VISGTADAEGVATFSLESERLGLKESHEPSQRFLLLGELEFKAYYFVFDPRVVPGLAVRTITNFARMYGGVRVYRNGFRVPPYGEPNDDWLQLAFDTGRRTLLVPANNINFFGQVMLNIERNLLLEETSGREGLIENEAFAELQTFVRVGLEWGAKRVASVRERKVDPGKARKAKEVDPSALPSAALSSVISTVSSVAAQTGDAATEELVEELERVKEAQQVFEEEVDAERERSVRYEEMLRILASLGMSIAVFGHEIGGALTIVGAEIVRLKRDAQIIKAASLDFTSAEDAIAKLGDLGRYIVDVMSSAESRELVSVPLHTAIIRFVNQFSTYLNKQGISFETSIDPPYLRTAPIHRSEIDAVLFNFMTNSLKAMRRASVSNGRIRISATRRDDFAVLSFQDNGAGIPSDVHERIFDAFYTTTDYAPDEVLGAGSGLGLKIVSDIAAVYNGWVKVGTPESGFATRLDFALPVADGQV
jgi:signal transduction histidine kinase